jgi:ferredoxin
LKIVRVDALSGDDSLPQLVENSLGETQRYWEQEDVPSVAAMIKDDIPCTRCGLCADRCPTGAITMETFRFREKLTYRDT